ncbi:hypothetical protein AMAG_09536 [Allomyces macrogynus ATCC 38327]|uniref:Uncharacterized protein n=1 Tax=Allomyces macrogynus (strain ATCC 38327) TaxID=578462 RepID=A0A0L0SPV2_ALLM3|nr:hypothetical protein AMAG_09536 [Allomyces macrogynus ATCC 38327]|eukprot:KNE64521.1 hypothetical protein AMAG_09536 [Allomyces macrogynus ATCC 38327]
MLSMTAGLQERISTGTNTNPNLFILHQTRSTTMPPSSTAAPTRATARPQPPRDCRAPRDTANAPRTPRSVNGSRDDDDAPFVDPVTLDAKLRASPLLRPPTADHVGKAIVYLEPRPDTPLYRAVLQWFCTARAQFGPDEGQQYLPHVSATGFFDASDADLGTIAMHLATNLPAATVTSTQFSLTGLIRVDATTLLLGVDSSRATGLHDLVASLQQAAPTRCAIRPKRIDHLSLAYFKLHSPPPATADPSAVDRAALEVLGPVLKDAAVDWDLVLYRVVMSDRLPKPHVFAEVQRWQL